MTVLSDISVFQFVTNGHQNAPSLCIISYTILQNRSLPFTFIFSTSSPQLTTLASCKGRHIRSTGRPSMCDTTSCPDSACPNTTCTLQQDVKTRFYTLTALCFFTQTCTTNWKYRCNVLPNFIAKHQSTILMWFWPRIVVNMWKLNAN